MEKLSKNENIEDININEKVTSFKKDDLITISNKAPKYLLPIIASLIASCTEKSPQTDHFYTNQEVDHSLPTNITPNIAHLLLEQMPLEYRNEENLAEDPAMLIVRQLGYDLEFPHTLNSLSDTEKAEWVMRAARGMYLMGLEPTEDNFNQIIKLILETATDPSISEKKLFTDRNVAVFAGNEKMGDDSYRFTNSVVQDGIKQQHPADFKIFRPTDKMTMNDVVEENHAFTEYLTSHENVTLVFDMHGLPNEISSLTDYPIDAITHGDSVVSSVYGSIDVRDLASEFVYRYKKGIHDTPILIFTSCYSQNFIRTLYQEISEQGEKEGLDIPLPIAISSTEYGQYGLNNFSNKYYSQFFDKLLSKEAVDISDVMNIDFEHGGDRGVETNISVFAPKKIAIDGQYHEEYLQIAKQNIKNQKISEQLYLASLKEGDMEGKSISLFEIEHPEKARKIKEWFEKNKEESVDLT